MKKILIVDDDPTSLKSVESILISNGYDVKTSTHAEDIEQKVRILNPHLIIMDLMMPNVDGNQAVLRLQKNNGLKNIPVIFLTAIQVRDDERNLEAEINVANKNFRTLSKPIAAKALLSEIELLIK